jgi:hypothetical protein
VETKYKNVCIKKQQMWNVKCVIIPIIFGAAGILTKFGSHTLKTFNRFATKDSYVYLENTCSEENTAD